MHACFKLRPAAATGPRRASPCDPGPTTEKLNMIRTDGPEGERPLRAGGYLLEEVGGCLLHLHRRGVELAVHLDVVL
eukprot:1522581-Pyramimonas_sp.AAC.1